MAIYLIRHGETPGNAGRVVQTADTPLSERGRLQAQRLAGRLARPSHHPSTADAHLRTLTRDFGVRLLDVPTGTPPVPNPEISRQSTNLHALATRRGEKGGLERTSIARILASDLTRAAMTAEPLREVLDAPLAFEPLLQERNFGELRGTPYAELEVDIFAAGFAPPGGETWESFDARVDQAWRRVTAVARDTKGHLAVVTHGLVCFSLATRHLALPPEAEPRLGFANTSLTIVQAAPPHEVTLYNCTAHLEGEGAADGSATRV